MGEYRSLFLRAHAKSQKWDLHPPDLRKPERVPNLATLLPYRDGVEMAMATSFRGFSAQCGAVHFFAAYAIGAERKVDVPYVTIGDVLVKGNPRYGASYQKLKQDVRQGPSRTGKIDCHVWLTFPDMVILDLSLGVGLGYDQEADLDESKKDSYVIWGSPKELAERSGFDYRPYLVGYFFLFQSGMIEPAVLQRLPPLKNGLL